MNVFLKFFYEFFMSFILAIWNFFKGFFITLWDIVNVAKYAEIFGNYSKDFNAFEWILAILTILIVVALIALVVWRVVIWIKAIVLRRKTRLEKRALIEQIDLLNKKVIRLIEEKDKIMAMKVSKLGIRPDSDTALLPAGQKALDVGRFAKLSEVDKIYTKDPFVFATEQNFTLKELVNNFRAFSCKQLKLFYNDETIRHFIAGMATSRLIILQGISGTGKTSLPYAFGKYLKRDTVLVPVQPSWRDKTELVGYFNEFTKRFNETDFLKSIYESTYRKDIGFIVLDEMNLARVEYYFASVLSILEMPNRSEWKMEIVGDKWRDDPKHLIDGKILFPANVWFVGTANQDDSTFTITDKVYDRAIPIHLNSKGKPFEIETKEPCPISLDYIEKLFFEAKRDNPVSPESKQKFDKLDDFIIKNFKLAFGNRILKQVDDFVPVYVACGGKEIDGLDFMLTNKILRKLEGLNISFVQDSLRDMIAELDKLFGKTNMTMSKDYLNSLLNQA